MVVGGNIEKLIDQSVLGGGRVMYFYCVFFFGKFMYIHKSLAKIIEYII